MRITEQLNVEKFCRQSSKDLPFAVKNSWDSRRLIGNIMDCFKQKRVDLNSTVQVLLWVPLVTNTLVSIGNKQICGDVSQPSYQVTFLKLF